LHTPNALALVPGHKLILAGQPTRAGLGPNPGQTHEGLCSPVWGSFGEVTAPEALLEPAKDETSEQTADPSYGLRLIRPAWLTWATSGSLSRD
jgi:hypothetical protein